MSSTPSPVTIPPLRAVLKLVLDTLSGTRVLPKGYCANLSARTAQNPLLEAMTARIGEPPDHEVSRNRRRAGEQGLRVLEDNERSGNSLSSQSRNVSLDAFGGAVVVNGFAISIAGTKEDGGEELDEALAVLFMAVLKQLSRQQALELMAAAGNARYRDFDMAYFGI